MLTFIVHVRVKPECLAEMDAVLGDFCRQVLKNEPGVLYFDFARSVDEPDTCVVIEVYRDLAAREAHGKTQWLKDSLVKAALLTAGAPLVRQYVS